MSKSIIAVDIDDVLSENVPAFVAWCNKQYSLDLTVDEYDEDWSRMWQVDHAEATRRNGEFHASRAMASYKHDAQAIDVLKALKQRYDLVVITSRPNHVRDLTLEWLERAYPGLFDSVHFAGMWDVITQESHKATKADLARKLDIAYLIDDQPKHVLAVSSLGIPAVMFGDYGWNRDIDLPAGVVRCVDWAAVKEYFDAQT